jgi:hypothetical protein
MRTSIIVLVLVAAISTPIALGRYITWKPADPPPVSLQEALALANKDLNDDAYYCVAASLAKTFTGGDWELHYCTKQGKNMWVSVGADKSIRKSEHGFEY